MICQTDVLCGQAYTLKTVVSSQLVSTCFDLIARAGLAPFFSHSQQADL
jgi:hypothetical protein